MDNTKTSVMPVNKTSIRPMWMVSVAIFFSCIASFIATSLNKYGGFNYSGHATVLSDAVMESIGAAFLLPLAHLAIASFWKVKRNPATRRNVFFGWGLTIGAIQILVCMQTIKPARDAARYSAKEQVVKQPEEPAARNERLYTLNDWNNDIDRVLNIQSSEKISNGVKIELGCVKKNEITPNHDCIAVMVKRYPFERTRIVAPRRQVDLTAPGKSPLLLPFILVEDGGQARLMLYAYFPESVQHKGSLKSGKDDFYAPSRPLTKIALVTGDKLSFERNDYDGLMDLSTKVMVNKLGIASDEMAPVVALSHAEVKELLLSQLEDGVSVKFEGSHDIYLSNSESKELAKNLIDMVLVYYTMKMSIGGTPDNSSVSG